MDKIKKLKSVHECSKQNETNNTNSYVQGFTDFGIYIEKIKMQEFFKNDPKQSKIFLDYNIFDTEYDKYKTDYINQNCLRLPVVYISKFLYFIKNNNYNQEFYNRQEALSSKQQGDYVYEYLSAYSCVNLMNDLSKKQNKHILLLGPTEIYIKHLESIIYYAFEACKVDFTCQFFVIDYIESQYIYLKKYKFQSNKLIVENRGKRKISSTSSLQGYLVCAIQDQECIILFPKDYDELSYYSTRDKLKPQSTQGFHRIHRYEQCDYNDFRSIAEHFSQIRFHNDTIDVQKFDFCSSYITKLPTFPDSLKIQKKDIDELNQRLMNLDLNQSDEERIVKKVKKNKKSKNKDSFINDSSDEYDLDDVEYLPKTRSACRKVLKKDKITPTKKSIYNNLNENSKNTRKKSKQAIQVHSYLTPTEFSVKQEEAKPKQQDIIPENDEIL